MRFNAKVRKFCCWIFLFLSKKLSYNRLSMIGLELGKIEKKCTPNEKNELKNGLNLYLYSPD